MQAFVKISELLNVIDTDWVLAFGVYTLDPFLMDFPIFLENALHLIQNESAFKGHFGSL